MTDMLYFDDLHIGDRWLSSKRTVTEEDVYCFAHLTGDYNPLHIDADFAGRSPFRKQIAHGLLGLSFAAGLGSDSPRVDTAAFVGVNNWRFLKPVYFGDEVQVVTQVADLRPHGRRRGRVFWKRSLLNQNGEVVQEGMFETLVTCRSSSQRAEPELASVGSAE